MVQRLVGRRSWVKLVTLAGAHPLRWFCFAALAQRHPHALPKFDIGAVACDGVLLAGLAWVGAAAAAVRDTRA
jgi:hypothetical protein